MKYWFKDWFYRQTKDCWENKDEYEHRARLKTANQIATLERGIKMSTAMAIESDPHDLNDGLRINIKRVIGGSIITFRNYDRRVDRESSRTYIITEEQDFERELGKIITMESMRQTT